MGPSTSTKARGGHAIVSLDDPAIDKDYQRDAAEGLTAEMLYDRRWALTLLDTVLARIREEYRLGKTEVFDRLQALLTQKSRSSYGELAANLKMSEGAVRVTVHRLRQRFRELLRAEIANTVVSADQIDEELRHLFAVVSL